MLILKSEPSDSVTVNGFNARQVWELSKAHALGTVPAVTNYASFDPSDVTPAPGGTGVVVQVRWRVEGGNKPLESFWVSLVDGAPSAPYIKSFSSGVK